MRAGKLRHRVAVQREVDDVPVVVADDVPASVEPLTPREQFLAHQVRADLTHKITLRWRDELTAAHTILFEGRVFELGPPLSTEERRRDLVVTAVERRP